MKNIKAGRGETEVGLTGEEAKVLYDFIRFLTYLGLIVWIIRTIFRLLKWLYHAIWPARTQSKQRTKRHLSRKNQAKKQFKEKRWYPTGWYFDDETGLWTAPDYINNDPNTQWTFGGNNEPKSTK